MKFPHFFACFPSVLAIGLCFAGNASATLVTFDDITTSSVLTQFTSHAGLSWQNFFVQPGDNAPGSGYDNGTVSERYVAFNGGGGSATVSGGLFDFNSAYFTGAWRDGLSIIVSGTNSGTLLYTQTIVVNDDAPTQFVFNYTGIDTLSLASFGGFDTGTVGDGPHFALDNFVFNETPIPEPTTALFGAALLGVLGASRRHSKQS